MPCSVRRATISLGRCPLKVDEGTYRPLVRMFRPTRTMVDRSQHQHRNGPTTAFSAATTHRCASECNHAKYSCAVAVRERASDVLDKTSLISPDDALKP